MAVPRAKKAKKPAAQRVPKNTFDIVRTTNYLNLAVMIRTMYMVYGWRDKRLAAFMESYLALMEEIADNRCSVIQFVNDTKDLTGIDVKEMIDSITI